MSTVRGSGDGEIENTGLDEVQIITIRDRLEGLRELEKRREAVLKSLKNQDKLTPELEAAVNAAVTMAKLEDIYLPYRPKRRTRAMAAREKGLKPLAVKLLEQRDFDPFEEAKTFIDPEKKVNTAEEAIRLIESMFISQDNEAAGQVRLAIRDCYRMLLSLSMEVEIRMATKKRTDEEAIGVFVENLRELLLASPLGEKNILALDPGLRTGCKLVCLDRQGNLLHHETIFPLAPFKKTGESASTIRELCTSYNIEAVAYRKEHGPFHSRAQFMEIPGIGPKTFKQATGLLRIQNGDNPLDASAVHPESYGIVEAIASDLSVGIEDLIGGVGHQCCAFCFYSHPRADRRVRQQSRTEKNAEIRGEKRPVTSKCSRGSA